ncbi:unnamed protein product [Blepharisma stoltei]|uniref:Tetratricopeptide repeat protein n=1 Tax=Blepharisma stoltei TaxID=1481888 RepID=A0AAU9JAG4_9CILI|nr:unnamed protein product [Blepharisma stoltei]
MKSYPFTSPKLRSQRILTHLCKGFILSGKYKEGIESLSYLLPLLDKKSPNSEILELIEILIENRYFENEISDISRKLSDPEDSMIIRVLRNLKTGNYEEAQNIIKPSSYENWFINSAKSQAIWACLCMILEENAIELALKAYELDPIPIYALLLAEAYARAEQLDKAKEIFERVINRSNDPKMIFYYYNRVCRDPILLPYLHERDPRNESLTLEYMEFLLANHNINEAIRVGVRHVEYLGNSVRVRSLIQEIQGRMVIKNQEYDEKVQI